MTEVINGTSQRSVQYYYINSAYPPGTTVYAALDHVVYYGQSQWTARYKYCAPNNANNANGIPLLWTADDPMYSGPMHTIAYKYRTANNYTGNVASYGQISIERYWDGTAGDESNGAAVTTLTVPSATTRTETRSDGKTRTFNYTTAGYLTSCTDFMANSASQDYDANKWIKLVTDRNLHTTNYTREVFTGNVLQVQFPLTGGDTPGQGSTRPTVNYTYGSASCADANNRDSNNPYYVCKGTDEGGHVTQFWRDANKRVTRIDYPDGGYETFSYDAGQFYQLSTHQLTTGGTETFAYDARHRLQYYSDAYHSNPGNSSIQYSYDALDRVTGVTVPALSQTTNFDYNGRGQVMTTTLPLYNGNRYTIGNLYNADGTLQMRTDELGHHTRYTYDDYRRVRSVTPPIRGSGDNSSNVTYYYYDSSGTGEDYKYTDSNVTFVILPSGKKTKTFYDDNRRTSTVTAGYQSGDDATTTYIYDNAGNLTQLKNPRNYATITAYDERNRPSSVTEPLNRVTSFTYDTAGRKKTITRPDGQVITYVSFDEMNRVLQQNATQTPTGLATTKFTYYPSGLLNTMQDPHLSSGTDNYTYYYDLMGRKKTVVYPQDSIGVNRQEQWSYDTAGRLYQFTNRGNVVQTFSYDQLSRVNGFTWSDSTPNVTFGYDEASRLTTVNNANANVSRTYYNDNLLNSESESISGGYSKTVTYTYDGDGNRTGTTYPTPENYAFNYTYTGRNQLGGVTNWVTYHYDENGYTGDLTSRVLANGTQSTYTYDPRDRVTWISHFFNPGGRGFSYGYQDNTDNVKYIRRTGSSLGDVGDVFNYDLADQVTGVLLNVQSPSTTPTPAPNIAYDPNGNLNSFHPPYVTWQAYGAANDLSQYTTRTISGVQTTAAYDNKGNLTVGLDGSTYGYDAQNRLTSAAKSGGTTMYFTYDGLNRQVSRKIGVSGIPTFNVWDGWNLIEEYQAANSGATTAAYLYGATGLISGSTNGQFAYYFQDANGSTSHITDANGALLEWYRYDLQGTPVFYNPSDQQISASAFGVRHLFTGQQWYTDIGLYDLRNRFYSPDIGRFLQPDPTGFQADPTSLYRYCRNNPVAFSDPSGLNLTITLYPAGVGDVRFNHIGIGVNSPFTKGYYPTHGSRPFDDGAVKDDPLPGEGLVTLTIPTNSRQDRAVQRFIAYITAHPGTYDGLSNNCATFVEAALRVANLKNFHVPTTPFPNPLMHILMRRYSGNSGRNGTRTRRNLIENGPGHVGGDLPVGGFSPPGSPGGQGPIGSSGPSPSDLGNPGGPGGSGSPSSTYEPGPIDPYWPDSPPDWDPTTDTDPFWFDSDPYEAPSDDAIGSGYKVD